MTGAAVGCVPFGVVRAGSFARGRRSKDTGKQSSPVAPGVSV